MPHLQVTEGKSADYHNRNLYKLFSFWSLKKYYLTVLSLAHIENQHGRLEFYSGHQNMQDSIYFEVLCR
jgi:hypothetical protein